MNKFHHLGLTLLAVILLHGCEGTAFSSRPDPEPVPQTEILRFELTPDTVATEDTVLIHCIIEDSLDERFKFMWGLGSDTLAVSGFTLGPKIRWVAPDLDIPQGEVHTVSGGVTVDNGSEDSVSVGTGFDIPIIKQ